MLESLKEHYKLSQRVGRAEAVDAVDIEIFSA